VIFLVSYLNINLHTPGGQTGGRDCETQVNLCVEDTYCLTVPTLIPTSILESPAQSRSPSSGSVISCHVQGMSFPISRWIATPCQIMTIV